MSQFTKSARSNSSGESYLLPEPKWYSKFSREKPEAPLPRFSHQPSNDYRLACEACYKLLLERGMCQRDVFELVWLRTIPGNPKSVSLLMEEIRRFPKPQKLPPFQPPELLALKHGRPFGYPE